MPLGMMLRRMWRERRLLGVLLLAVCLVTGFFALGPLYVRAVSESGIRYAVDNTDPEDLGITVSHREPLGPDVWDLLDQELRGVVTDINRISRSSNVVNGYAYTLGSPTYIFTPPTANDYQVVAYSNMDDIFTVVEGRMPVRLAGPTASLVSGLSDEQMQSDQLGVYSRGEVEAVVSVEAAEVANIEVGNRLVVGADPTGPTAIVNVVGLVEPAIPVEDPFWDGQRIILTGRWIPIGLIEERFDFGLVVPEGAFEDWIAPTTEGNTYVWQLGVNPDVIHADTLDELEARLGEVNNTLTSRYAGVLIISGMFDLIEDFRTAMDETEGPILFISGAILLLMLYHLVTTVALVLEQQNSEWASISSRGGSAPQLIGMQLFTMTTLGIIGAIAGPFIAQGILWLLERFGPLARVLAGASLGIGSIPAQGYILSAVAAVAAVVVLTLPAWSAARRSLLHLKQLASRPPTQPRWAKYYLDFILLAIGFGLLLRLYFLISGDVGSSFKLLLGDPAYLVRLIASGADDVGGLNDPFNLLGPALLLTGTALLWLRIFPLLMHVFGFLLRSARGLIGPMALWNVERDPGHYAQLVLLLIGTLALGTASLALEATRDVGSWAIASHETGAYARLEFDTQQANLTNVTWTDVPEVTSGESVMVAATPHRAGQPDTVLLGIDPATFSASFPAWDETVAPLQNLRLSDRPGLELPNDANLLSVQVYSEASDLTTTTVLSAIFIDALGVPVILPMATIDPTLTDQFMTYTVNLPTIVGRPPWRFIGFQVMSDREDLQDFSHAIYLDDIAATLSDGEEVIVSDFEDDADTWESGAIQFQLFEDLVFTPTDEQALGAQSLRVDYRIRRMGGGRLEPTLVVNLREDQVVPLIVSRSYAEYYGSRTSSREPLRVGDEAMLNVDFAYGGVELRYRVVGFVEDFPTTSPNQLVAIGWTDQLRFLLNRTATLRGGFYDWNQGWLNLEQREPGADLISAVGQMPGLTDSMVAWDRYSEIQRDPLANALTGMLFAGFWVSLILSILDFGFYLAVTARRRAISFAVLQAIGWEAQNIWRVLVVEQAALIIPAMFVGVLLGGALAYLLLPFMELIGGQALQFPLIDIVGLLVVLAVAFVVLLGLTGIFLRRQSINQVLRLGEE